MSNWFSAVLDRRKQQAPALIDLAASFGVVLKLIEDVDGVYLVWRPPDGSGGQEVQLWWMAFNWRIVEVINETTIGRYWCYRGLGVDTFVLAVRAVRRWQGDRDSEPIGWMQSSDGRTGAGYSE